MVAADSTSRNGFSLMEVLVALSVLATAAVGFMSVIRGGVEGTRQVEEKQLARIIADNQLTDLFWSADSVELGITQGVERQMGRDFGWIMSVSEGPQDGIWLVGVEVRVANDPRGSALAQAGTLIEARQ